jgi:acyl-homoserine-lactone acylase
MTCLPDAARCRWSWSALLVLVLAVPRGEAFSQRLLPAVSSEMMTQRDAADGTAQSYRATIRRTTHGVAHIEAADLPSLGFGEGYAQAEDNVCTIADQVIRVRGHRARYLGRGQGDRHLRSDIVMQALRVRDGGAELLAREPKEIRDWVDGFVAGYNRYLGEAGPQKLPEPCRGSEWVTPIAAADVAGMYRAVLLATSTYVTAISTARPPEGSVGGDAGDGEAAFTTADAIEAADELRGVPLAVASNGWAIGRERSESGRGMLLVNPHYPWAGGNRFWEKHLRIPGQLDVYGANIIGGMGVLLGFNDHVAWTHTAAGGPRVTSYSVDLVPGHPTRYRYGTEVREMTSRAVAIDVSGEPEPVRHTVWFTHYGPVLSSPQLGWSEERAVSVRDVADENMAFLRHVLATNRARSLDELRRAHAEHQAIHTLHTMAVSADGVAWYADARTLPNLSPSALGAWRSRAEADPLVRALWGAGMPLLDGSDPQFEWVTDRESRLPGIIPFSRTPQIERTDYVFNANDSYWLPHAQARIEGEFTPFHGRQGAAVSPRTRINALLLDNAEPYRAAGPEGRFSLREVQEAILGNHGFTAEMLVPELVDRCRATPRATVGGAEVDLTEACNVLAAWDRRYDVGSRGAALFREWIGRYPLSAVLRKGNLLEVEFDPARPLETPRGLAAGPLALENLAHAVNILRGRGIPLDVPLGELQFAPTKLPARIPVSGGDNHEGVANMMLPESSGIGTVVEATPVSPRVQGSSTLREYGYPVYHGSSFIMAVEFTDQGPNAAAILTYGQSADPASEHFTDQTRAFARKEWRRVRFREADVSAGVVREYTVTDGGR